MNPVDHSDIPPPIRADAAAWLARLRSDDAGSADQAGFRAWLAEDARHAAAFEHLNAVWDMAGGLDREPEADEEGGSRIGRRALLVGGTATLSAMAGGVYWFTRYVSYSTEVGEQRRVSLADGSSVTLDTNTELRVALSAQRRQIEMVRGRAHFQVATDVLRPFVVDAGETQVVALGTAFDVSEERSRVAVILVEGKVAVQPALDANVGEATILAPGERVIYGSRRALVHDRPPLQLVTAWQRGQAMFDNETLAGAVLEMNRYSLRPVVIADRALETLRISGVYEATDAEGFARSITALLPVSVDIGPDRITLRAV